MTLRSIYLPPSYKRKAVQSLRLLDRHLLDTPLDLDIWDNYVTYYESTNAGVVKLVDAPDSKSGVREDVPVRLRPPAQNPA
jgi:hypothetical protein